MKKLITILVLAAMLLTTFVVAASETYLGAVNSVDSISDIPEGAEYGEADEYLTGSAASESRESLAGVSGDDAYVLVINSSFNAAANKEGISSGWLLDNRGGVPRNELIGNYGQLSDVSDKAGTALIREFNKTETGLLSVYAKVIVDGNDGAYLEFRNDKEQSVYQVMLKNGGWQLLGADGKYTELCKLGDTMSYDFRVFIDLDNRCAATYINGKDCGVHSLSVGADGCNLLNFRFATTDEAITCFSPLAFEVTANYALYDNFSFLTDGKPFGWELKEAEVQDGALNIRKGGTADFSFDPVSGKPVAEFMYLYRASDELTLSLGSDGKDIAVFTTDNEGFSVNGENVYKCDFSDLWYRLRFELDVPSQTMLVKVNGRDAATIPFAAETASIDSLHIESGSNDAIQLDNFRVFRVYDRADYVPEPVVPTDSEGYIVGMNVCSLWRNGAHYGWSCVSPYDDTRPVLGYYDEGLPETADWEIKYTVEHGIDFQAFCIYMGHSNAPQRPEADHLYDGFMNAKYSDLTKFCVIWECANAGSPYSMDEWQKNYVPYFIENYFKDPRHIVIDNRPVLCVFGADYLSSSLGGDANVKMAFDYLEEEIKKYGFDGMIYLACGSSSSRLADMGFDGCYAYNWGINGYKLEVNTSRILSSANEGSVYTVPTVSVGFNSIPWHGTRYPMMSMTDYASAHEWVKNEYLTTYPEEEWQKKLVMLSTWNEYGEGTYLMPTTDEKGFGYLDVIREAYTDEKIDASINTLPTAEQLYRINRLYPQYRRLLRLNGSYTEQLNEDNSVLLYAIDFSERQDAKCISISDVSYSDDGLSGKVSRPYPMITLNSVEPVDLDSVDYIRITAKLEKGSSMQIFFLTDTDKTWDETKGKSLSASTGDTELTYYYIPASELKGFTGSLAAFRIDPGNTIGNSFTVKSVEFLKMSLSKTIVIDGNSFNQKLRPQRNGKGEICVAFDPSIGMDFALNCFHLWEKETGTLTLNFVDHTVVYTVGSDSYLLDGVSKKLTCALGSVDALPLIPIEQLCADVGYKCSVGSDGIVTIETDYADYYAKKNEGRVYAQWEFDFIGDTEGWSSSSMQLLVNNGYLSCTSIGTSNDPILYYGNEISIDTSKYTKLECKVRYKYSGSPQQLVIYFATDKDGNMDEEKTLRYTLGGLDSQDEWETFTIDLTKLPQWKDTVTNLRFDPFNAVGHMDIDYIRFVPDETTVVTSAETTEDPPQEPATPEEPTTPDESSTPEESATSDDVTSDDVTTDATDSDKTTESDDIGILIPIETYDPVVSEDATPTVTGAPTESAGSGEVAPPTGSPIIIAAVVAAISACGAVVAKKRK